MKYLIPAILFSLIIFSHSQEQRKKAVYQGWFLKVTPMENSTFSYMDLRLKSGKVMKLTVKKDQLEEIKKLKANQKIMLIDWSPGACDCHCFDELKVLE